MRLWKSKMFLMITGIAILYTILVYPNISSINNWDYTSQFLLSIFIIAGASYLVGVQINGSWRNFTGFMCVFLAIDLLIFPLLLSQQGILAQADIIGGSIDAILFMTWQGLGITGSDLWFCVYPISFIILMSTGLYILNPAAFKRTVRQAVV